jgi:hypothetical protein
MAKVDLFLMHDLPYPRYLEMARLADASGCENLWLIDAQKGRGVLTAGRRALT